MVKAYTTWTVNPHGPVEKLSSRILRVEGAIPNMPMKRVMTVARLSDGRLAVHSAIALDEAGMRALDEFGEVGFIIVPNGWHRLDARIYLDRYPKAKVLCPPASRAKVEEVVPVDGSVLELPSDPAVGVELVDGTDEAEGLLIVNDETGSTVVLNDCVFNMPHVPGLSGLILRYVTASSGGPKVTRLSNLMLLKDKPAFSAHLERLASTKDLRRVIVSHHQMIDRDPAAVLRRVASSVW